MSATLGANATYYQPPAPPPSAYHAQAQGQTNWNYQIDLVRKPVRSQGAVICVRDVVANRDDRGNIHEALAALRRNYGFQNDEIVSEFLTNRRAVRSTLTQAFDQLQAYFGADKIFNLEVSQDEDGSQTLYATTIWQADSRSASAALRQFWDNWWLERMTPETSDLAFVYKLV